MIQETWLLELQERFERFRPSLVVHELPEAAVLIALVLESGEPEIIFTRRATHMNSHAGQVAFPGGKKDLEDSGLFETALREAEEEIALPRASVSLLGSLSQVISRHGLMVSPYIVSVEGQPNLVPNPEELDAIFRVPVSYFIQNEPDCYDCIKFPDGTVYIPCYFYDDYEIWGLSAMVLSEFLNVGFDRKLNLFVKPEGEIRYR